MSPEDHEEFLRRFPDVLACIERFAQGEQRRDYALRRGIVQYWYTWWRCCIRDDFTRADESWVEQLLNIHVKYCESYDALVDESQSTPLEKDTREVKDGLLTLMGDITSRGSDLEELGQQKRDAEAARLVHDLLSTVFDWGDNFKLQMYLWTVTKKRPDRGYVGVQKKLVWNQIQKCGREHLRSFIDN